MSTRPAQSPVWSLIETCASVAVGFFLTLVLQAIVYPLFGIHTSFATNLWLTLIFTLASIARGYVLRRVFERLHNRSA